MEEMLTGIHRQNHIRMMLISKEAFPDKVLHLCDGCSALKTGSQQERSHLLVYCAYHRMSKEM